MLCQNRPSRKACHGSLVLIGLLALILIVLTSCQVDRSQSEKDVRALNLIIDSITLVNGSMAELHERGGVTYTLKTISPDGEEEISYEVYTFDRNMKSEGTYLERFSGTYPQLNGVVKEQLENDHIIVYHDDVKVNDEQILNAAKIKRISYMFWFMFIHDLKSDEYKKSMLTPRTINNIPYQRVMVKTIIGKDYDSYTLYVNPKTYHVDRIEFQTAEFGDNITQLFEVDYVDISGMIVPKERRYTILNNRMDEQWVTQRLSDVRFIK